MFWRRKERETVVIEKDVDQRTLTEIFGEDNLYEGTLIQLMACKQAKYPNKTFYESDFTKELAQRGLFKNKPQIILPITPTNSLFTPISFAQYIGQKKAKQILTSYITATQNRQKIFPHLLIHGRPGMGKTSLANIVASSLSKNLTQHIASSITERGQLQNIINELNGNILFIDEVHALPRIMIEPIYQMMEQFEVNGNKIMPFTIIGATTEIGEIIKDRKPFYDRFKIIIELEDYTINDLKKIGEQYKNQVFPNDVIDTKIYGVIARNSRSIPRTVIRLLDATIYLDGKIDTVLSNFGIVKNGYTEKDVKLLKYLSQQTAVGLQGIAAFLDTSLKTYLYEIEPHLFKNEIVIRTPRGRAISPKGIQLLKQLER